ncbi:MAG: hypothetical protein KC910_27410 [Candidatus Eremiobacteraeota bacterium]|nr:hypothetical protein [Candidatus Eremiobacteraeota bacterium]
MQARTLRVGQDGSGSPGGGYGRGRRRKPVEAEEEENENKPKRSWASLRTYMELADDLEIFWLEGFDDTRRARRFQKPQNSNSNEDAIFSLKLCQTMTGRLPRPVEGIRIEATTIAARGVPAFVPKPLEEALPESNSNSSNGDAMSQLFQMSLCQRVRFSKAYDPS